MMRWNVTESNTQHQPRCGDVNFSPLLIVKEERKNGK